jgi:hypothetical protein
MGIAMLAGLVVQQGFVVWRLGSGRMFDLTAAEALSATDRRDVFLGAQLGAQLLELALIWWIAGLGRRDRRQRLNLVPVRFGLGGWVRMIGLLFLVKIVATMAASGIAPADPAKELGPFVALVQEPAAWLVFLATVVLAGLTEELLFRGILSRTLEGTRLGFWAGASLASAAFAVLHMQYGVGGQLVIFAIGLALAWIRRSSGSLWPAIVAHAANNAVALVAMRFLG